MSPVIGPGRRGVVVATRDPEGANRDRAWLEGAGVPAATPADAGVRLAAGEESAGALAERWAACTRRPTVASDGGDVFLAAPARSAAPVPRDEALGIVPGLVDQSPPPRVAVFGGAWISEDEPEYRQAMRLGRRLVERGTELVTGGYQGIMAAVSRGASQADGVAVGVTIAPWSERVAVNRWLSHEVVAEDLLARLPLICDADSWVAFPGGVGTLSEVALCWNLVQTESLDPRPLVIVGERWDRALRSFRELLIAEGAHFDLVQPAASADAAVEALLAAPS